MSPVWEKTRFWDAALIDMVTATLEPADPSSSKMRPL
jgi:hypothetical protein